MKPIYITINETLNLKVIPDSQFHINGHPVLTHNYNIYINEKQDADTVLSSNQSSDKMTDEDYYGAIAFEKPGKLFSYTPGEHHHLTRDEIQEIILLLSHHRDNPANWNIEG